MCDIQEPPEKRQGVRGSAAEVMIRCVFPTHNVKVMFGAGKGNTQYVFLVSSETTHHGVGLQT